MRAGFRYPFVLFAVLCLCFVLLASCNSALNEPIGEEAALEKELEAASTALAVKVRGSSIGRSSTYIGANGANRFNINDIKALGLTTYRLWGGMARFEPVDDDGVYGSPSIADMKRVLSNDRSRVNQFVNWTAFDRRMNGFGNQLKDLYKIPGMRPVMLLRNSDNGSEFWVPKMNVTGSSCTAPNGSRIVWPQFTQNDWNEWWQHVFAVVYWINVRNGGTMRVDHWGVHNEPNQLAKQGWCGTKEQYREFVKYTSDAIDFVYKTYLNNRPRWVFTSTSRLNGDEWRRLLFRNGSGKSFSDRNFYQPSMFNVISLNAHGKSSAVTNLLQTTRNLTLESGVPNYVRNYPIWTTELGINKNGAWDDVPTIIDSLVNNFIVASTPGKTHVEGAIAWRMYDSNSGNTRVGLIRNDGVRRSGFYAFRLVVMALNGGKQVFPTQFSNSYVKAITTRESSNGYNLLITNTSSSAYAINADIAELLRTGRAELYLFSGSRKGAQSLQPFSNFNFSGGRLNFNLPPRSVVLVRFRS